MLSAAGAGRSRRAHLVAGVACVAAGVTLTLLVHRLGLHGGVEERLMPSPCGGFVSDPCGEAVSRPTMQRLEGTMRKLKQRLRKLRSSTESWGKEATGFAYRYVCVCTCLCASHIHM